MGYRNGVILLTVLVTGGWVGSARADDPVKEPITLKGHAGLVGSVAFSPDGKIVASASEDSTIKLWDVATAKELATLKGHKDAVKVTFSPDGKTLTSTGWDGTIKLWDVQTDMEQTTHKEQTGTVQTAALSSDGKTPSPTSQLPTVSPVQSVAMSPDCKTVALGRWDTTIRLLDAATGAELATLKGHTDSVSTVTFSPDSKTLASGSRDNTIKCWDVATGKERTTLKGHTDAVQKGHDGVEVVAFSPDGKTLASGNTDNIIKLWDVGTGKEQVTFKGHTIKGHQNWVTVVAFSPDGKTLISGNGDNVLNRNPYENTPVPEGLDNTIKLWDVATGKVQATLKGHQNWVTAIAISPDGKTLASGSKDKTIKLWAVSPQK